MADQHHPITPPPELVDQWLKEFYGPTTMPGMAPGEVSLHIAAVAARWGADTELEACCDWLDNTCCDHWDETAAELRAARRPKPSSLVRRALHILGTHGDLSPKEHDTIRQALEHLDD